MGNALGISGLFLLVTLLFVIFAACFTIFPIVRSVLLYMVLGAQLYPLNEILQLHKLGPSLLRHYLSGVGSAVCWAAAIGCTLAMLFSMRSQHPPFPRAAGMESPRTRQAAFKLERRYVITPLVLKGVLWGSAASVGVLALYEWQAITIGLSVDKSPLYSGEYDWGDVVASAVGVMPIVVFALRGLHKARVTLGV